MIEAFSSTVMCAVITERLLAQDAKWTQAHIVAWSGCNGTRRLVILMSVRIEADFLGDLRATFVRALDDRGYSVDPGDHVDVVVEKLFNLVHRTIPTRPRRVLRSVELMRTSLSDGDRVALGTIERESVAGANLTRRLSLMVAGRKANLAYDDDHLNDFRIAHLHLGSTMLADGMIAGADALLFVTFDDEHLYFIDFGKHTELGHRRFFDIANRNWPQLYARDRLDMVVDVDGGRPEQLPRRPQGSGKLTQLIRGEDGCVYVAGGGQMLSGLSAEVARRADATCNAVVQFERACIDNAVAIARGIEESGAPKLEVLKLKLVILPDGTLQALETQSNRRFG